ncbi:hypothetical protein Scep_005583 [Stephania cephalantha]|uniref:Peroxisomal nicotinamide adenine dinucleotide carrier n=1 Tax=Stephania cephalantha TaxID=152367 RepID=A0AAP0PYB6_9MAGN
MSDALINGVAGAGGGIIAQLITYPLQTVNTRQQTNRGPKKTKRKLTTIEQMCQVVKHEGWERLYGGLLPSLVGTAASQGVYYYFYQIFRDRAEAAARDRLKKGLGDGSVGMFSSLVVAAYAGCVNVLLTNPIWVVVTRMQTYKKSSTSAKAHSNPSINPEIAAIESPSYATSHAVQEVYDEAGVFGFWKGVFPTLIMVSNPSIQFMLYETMLKKLRARRAKRKEGNSGVTALEVFLLGAVAKLGATVVTYPLLVVKSRLQAKQETEEDKKHHYKGWMILLDKSTGTHDAIIKMIHYEGFSGFYQGMSTKIVQSVLAAAVLFMVKEELVKGVRLLMRPDINLVKKVRRPP